MSLRPSIEDLRGLGHHQTLYDWGIQFISIPSAITGFTNSDLNTRCQSAKIPTRNVDDINISLRGHEAFQHGIMHYDHELTLTLYETIDAKVKKFLDAYMNIQWVPLLGTQTPKLLNQSSFLLTLLDTENNETQSYTIMGAWLKSYQPSGELTSGESSILTWNTTWQYDYFL